METLRFTMRAIQPSFVREFVVPLEQSRMRSFSDCYENRSGEVAYYRMVRRPDEAFGLH
jgi:hypothetical protein